MPSDELLFDPDPEEDTPVLALESGDAEEPEYKTIVSGVIKSCYTCGRTLLGLPESSILRKISEKIRKTPSGPVTFQYQLSYCAVCVSRFHLD